MDLLSAVFNFLSPPSNFVRGHDSNVSDIVGVAPQCHTCIDCYRPGPRACSRCHMLEISILNGFETSKYLVELQCFRLLANDVLYWKQIVFLSIKNLLLSIGYGPTACRNIVEDLCCMGMVNRSWRLTWNFRHWQESATSLIWSRRSCRSSLSVAQVTGRSGRVEFVIFSTTTMERWVSLMARWLSQSR